MNNLVKVEYRGKIYEGYNELESAFVESLKNILITGGEYTLHPSDYLQGTTQLSISPYYKNSTSSVTSSSVFETGAYVGIYAMRNEALIYTPSIINIIGSTNLYSLSSTNSGFILEQYFQNNTSSNVEIDKFILKDSYYTGADVGYGKYNFHPVASVTTKKIFNLDYITLQPYEVIKIDWTFDFTAKERITTSVNNKPTNCLLNGVVNSILSSSAYTINNSTTLTGLQINNLVAYIEPNKSQLNTGVTGTNYTAFSLKQSVFSVSGQGTRVIVSNRYKNLTESNLNIGSIILGSASVTGSYNNVRFAVPLSYANAIDVWGVDIKTIQPQEYLDLTWEIELNPTTQTIVLAQ